MSRKAILEDTLARLEAERFQPPHRVRYHTRPPPAEELPAVTPEQAERNVARLLAALTDEVIDLAERRTA